MSLKQDLKNLQAQRRAELSNLHYVYLRTKTDAQKAVSPQRFIRKHLGASLGAAAIAGLLLAPRPAPRASKEKEAASPKFRSRPKKSSLLHRLSHLLTKTLTHPGHHASIATPQVETNGNGHHNGNGNGHAPSGSATTPKLPKVNGILGIILTTLLSRLDLSRIVTELTKHLMQRLQHAQAATTGSGKPPTVTVADAGTVKPHDYENFE